MNNELFTAAKIARALGCSKQNVHQRLAHIPADGELSNNGNVAKAWRTESLPKEVFEKLCEIRDTEGCRSIAHLILDPPTRRAGARLSLHRPISIARERNLEVLEDALETLSGVTVLSVEQKTYLWTKGCDELDLQIRDGGNEKKIKRSILKVLLSSSLLGRDRETIRRNLNRQWTAYRKNDGWLVDRRTVRDQCKELPAPDKEKLVARVLDCGGRVSQAFRECRDNGELSRETLENSIANPSRKSYVPTAVRRSVGNRFQIKPLLVLHRSERDFELSSAHNVRDYSNFFPGDSYQADDCTCPVYYWEPDFSNKNGYSILRGQLIMLIDERSLLTLGFALHSERNYNARIIRALITRVHDQWGLPRHRFYFERGIWKDSKILTGGKNGAAGFDVPSKETEMGLREFGIRFCHANYPRGKVIERVIGIVQNEMDRLPGYAGRNERDERHDRVKRQINQANAAHVHPSTFLMQRDEWLNVLSNLIDRCNSERREGRILNGKSSLEAWNLLQPPEGQVHLGEKARVLLAEHRLKMRVGRNGVTLRPSLGGGTYCGEATGRLRGQDVLVWVNPENLDAIGITSLDRKQGPFVVPRLAPLPAIAATPEQFAASERQLNAHNQYTRTIYRLVSPHLAVHNFRPLTFVDSRTAEIGGSLDEQKAVLTRERRKMAGLVRRAQREVRSSGINPRMVTMDAERSMTSAELIREADEEANQ